MSNMTLFAAEIDHNIYTIDLHRAHSVYEAKELFERELYALWKTEIKYCKVIYGIGEGILEKEILKEIKKHPLIDAYKEQPGSALVAFAK